MRDYELHPTILYILFGSLVSSEKYSWDRKEIRVTPLRPYHLSYNYQPHLLRLLSQSHWSDEIWHLLMIYSEISNQIDSKVIIHIISFYFTWSWRSAHSVSLWRDQHTEEGRRSRVHHSPRHDLWAAHHQNLGFHRRHAPTVLTVHPASHRAACREVREEPTSAATTSTSYRNYETENPLRPAHHPGWAFYEQRHNQTLPEHPKGLFASEG